MASLNASVRASCAAMAGAWTRMIPRANIDLVWILAALEIKLRHSLVVGVRGTVSVKARG